MGTLDSRIRLFFGRSEFLISRFDIFFLFKLNVDFVFTTYISDVI